MRIALVADFHGNWPAVEALEKDLKGQHPDRIICLGDVVGKGPSSDKTFDWAMANCEIILGGNWDYGVGYQMFENDGFYWEQLGEKRLKVLRGFPMEHVLSLSGRRIRLFHGRPVMPELIRAHGATEDIEPYFWDAKGKRYDVVGYADAHRQALRSLTPGMLFNCGSVGDAMGEPRCCYALLEGDPEGTGPLEIRFRSLDYDRAQSIRDAEAATGCPRIETYINEIKTGVYSRNL